MPADQSRPAAPATADFDNIAIRIPRFRVQRRQQRIQDAPQVRNCLRIPPTGPVELWIRVQRSPRPAGREILELDQIGRQRPLGRQEARKLHDLAQTLDDVASTLTIMQAAIEMKQPAEAW